MSGFRKRKFVGGRGIAEMESPDQRQELPGIGFVQWRSFWHMGLCGYAGLLRRPGRLFYLPSCIFLVFE
jgi:hypothetical protein